MIKVTLDEGFYVGEGGFDFIVTTGLDMSDLIEGQIKSVLQRPCGSISVHPIALAGVMDLPSGKVLFSVETDDLSESGTYQAQVFIRDSTGRQRPSHIFAFDVTKPLVNQQINLFP